MKTYLERILERLGLGETDYISLNCTDGDCHDCLSCDHRCHLAANA